MSLRPPQTPGHRYCSEPIARLAHKNATGPVDRRLARWRSRAQSFSRFHPM